VVVVRRQRQVLILYFRQSLQQVVVEEAH